ncbi:MAG: hypothetical protein RBT35_00090, partial [Bacteroidales bacterium]|nr:hypothetical protein [Bacteroidales bacterium]
TPDGYYSIQILAVTKILKSGAADLKGVKEFGYKKVGAFYKYHTGTFTEQEDAAKFLKDIRKRFPQAFLIRIENNTIVPLK